MKLAPLSSLLPPPPGNDKTLLERVEDALLPLINLVFLLLMFFLVAGQLSDDRLPDLPGTADTGSSDAPHADLVVQSVDQWSVGGEAVDRSSLARALPAQESGAVLRVAVDRDLSMAELETVFQALEAAGHGEILLLTEPGQ